MFKTFPDNKVHNRQYKTLFASGDWTCSIAVHRKGPMIGPGGKGIPPTGKPFEGGLLHSCALGERGDRRGEPLYDVVGLMSQIGVGK